MIMKHKPEVESLCSHPLQDFFPQEGQRLILEQPALPSRPFGWGLQLEASEKTGCPGTLFSGRQQEGRKGLSPDPQARPRPPPGTGRSSQHRMPICKHTPRSSSISGHHQPSSSEHKGRRESGRPAWLPGKLEQRWPRIQNHTHHLACALTHYSQAGKRTHRLINCLKTDLKNCLDPLWAQYHIDR